MEISIRASLPTDSLNYEVITEAVERTVGVPGMTCEIGLRRGGGSKFIMDALSATKQNKVHVAIDPYGNIEYASNDHDIIRQDYTNDMRNDCMINMFLYSKQIGIPFIFFNLEDTEFFTRFADGVPVYSEVKELHTEYSFVHFDGPHAVRVLKTEIDFFHARTPKGATWVFDDVALYNHTEIHEYLKTLNWKLFRTTPRKWAYIKE